ncbi:MAG: diguanylate cyclase domain-containing protein [Burkholderiales bacterium]
MYAQIDIDIFSILLLAVVLFNNVKTGGLSQIRQRLFRAIVVCDMLILAFDIAITALLGGKGMFVHILLGILYCYLFALGSLLSLLWALFCFQLRKGGRASLILLFVPFLVLVVCLLISFANGMIFSITDDNLYVRGPMFHLTTVCTYSYVLYALIQLLKHRKDLSSSEFYPYLLMPTFPMIAGIIQAAFNIDVLIVWPSVAIALLVIELYSLEEKMNIDHMTGLYNRKYLDVYIEEMLQMGRLNYDSRSSRKFAALMLDIDSFKVINDTYGHLEGDNAIKTAAGILSRSVRKGDFVSRYGGDEFLIILNHCSANTPDRVIKRINENTARYNAEHNLPYTLEFSVGYKVFSNVSGLTGKDILASIDELMYKNKQSKAFADIPKSV